MRKHKLTAAIVALSGIAVGMFLGRVTTSATATAADCEIYQDVPDLCETSHAAQSYRDYGQEWIFVSAFREDPADPKSGRVRGWAVTKRRATIDDDGVTIWIPDRIVRIVGGGYVD